MDVRLNTTNGNTNRFIYEQALGKVNEPERKRQRLEVDGSKQQPTKEQQQLQKKNVVNARSLINFTNLVGYKRLQCVGPNESRTIVSRLYNFDKFKNISGGFRLYLRLMTDAILNEICDKIDDHDHSDCFDKAKDMDLCIAQILRYTWSQLSEKERLIYEIVARCKVQKKYEAEMNKMKNCQNAGSEKSIEEAEMQWIRSLPAMPLTEFKFMSTWVKKQKENEYHRLHSKRIRCPFCKYSILGNDTLQLHILNGHHNMYVYACHCCFKGFTSLEQLKKHHCQEFTEFMLQLLLRETKLEMKFAMHTLICAECNLQVPLSSLNNSSSDKKHIKLQRLLTYHSTDKLVSCITLFAVCPSKVKYVTMKACTMKSGIPLQCKFCSHRFISAADIEKHQLNEHCGEVTKLKCPVCPRFYITDCFFRDHLLSHLGELNSMTSILYKATLLPPAFSHETSFKMGPSLQKIIGSDMTELSRVEKSNDLSDDEDESYEKSILNKKMRGMNEKKKKKIRRTDQDLCYYCKHARQVMTKPLRSSLCRCIKSKHEPKSFIVRDSFMKSLVEKFTREGRLYVDKGDSILDTTIGAIIDDSVFICVKCKGLHLGDENTLKHLRICMQKDVESPDPEKHFDLMDSKIVIRLTYPHCSPNSRISCPECEVTCCSIASLRRHLALDHGIFAYYNIPESHKAVGIMEYAPSRIAKDAKADLATRINLELNLTPTGEFKIRHNKRSQSPPVTSASCSTPVTSNVHVTGNFQRSLLSAETRPTLMQNVTESPQSSELMGKFICIVCFVTSDSSQQSANHFVRSHLHLCSECGSGFTEKQSLLSHLLVCQKWPRKCSDGEFFPRCPICSSLLPTPERYFYHLLYSHKTYMRINQKSQQINPMFIWKKVSLKDAAKLRKKLMDTLVGKTHTNFVKENVLHSSIHSTKNASGTESTDTNRFLCALCELDFPNQAECDVHLQKHPEQWTCCPVCAYFRNQCPIRTVSELFEHLLFKHTVKSLQPKGVKIVCSLCRSLSSCESTTPLSVRRCEEQMIRHILYACNGTQVCFLCNDGAVRSPEKLKKHRVSEHRVIFERFGCSGCSRKFHTCSSFKKHSCNVLLKCSCGINTLFTEEEFEKHFDIHLNSMKDFCLLCNKYMFSRDQLFSHVVSHRIAINGKRQLVQLNTPDSVLSSPAPNIALQNNMSINASSEERNATIFSFGKVKADNDDDEIQFLGLEYLTDDTNGSGNKDQDDVVLATRTVPNNCTTSKVDVAEAGSPCCTRTTEATETSIAQLPTDETSQECGSSTTVCNANAANVVCNTVDRQNSATTNERPISTVERRLTSARTPSHYHHKTTDDEDDVVIVDELKNENLGINEALKDVKAVDDKTGDLDLEVIKDAERCTGFHKISKREAKFCCGQCTEKFLTKTSLAIHKETHRYDAGQTIEAVYGIPIEATVHICRLCCLAYESHTVYQVHMRTHGVLRNCERCSVVAFNEEQMKNHQDQHVISAGKQQSVYVCSKCVATYSTDGRLYHHMFIFHAQAILYFCKNCGLANTNGRVVYEHIIRRGCSWQNLSQVPDFVIMGFTAACIFHYQPVNPVQYESRVRNNELLVVIPSECIHRSFLSHPNDVISITCPICNSLMSFLRLQAENPKFTGSLPRTLNHATDDNDAMILTMLNIWKMECSDHQASTMKIENRQTLPVQPRRMSTSVCVRQPLPQISWVPVRQALTADPASVLFPASSSSSSQTAGTNSHRDIPTTILTTPDLVSSSVSTLEGIYSSMFSKAPPHLQPYRGVLEAVSLKVNTQVVSRDYIVKNAEGKYFCAKSGCANVRIEKITSGRVHNLRHNPQNIFFCLECGSAFPFENLIVNHMVEFHHQKQTPSLNLRCPLCPETPPFNRVDLFRKHLAGSKVHLVATRSFQFKRRCKLRFRSAEAQLRHEHDHHLAKNAQCCFVCGTSRNWWSSAERSDFPYVDHSYIHAFSLWGMCRECGLCYPNELKNQQYFLHFEDQHMIKKSGVWHCKICNIRIDSCDIYVHVLQRHFVIGVKRDRRKPYAVETSDAMMRAFLGYPVPDNARI